MLNAKYILKKKVITIVLNLQNLEKYYRNFLFLLRESIYVKLDSYIKY